MLFAVHVDGLFFPQRVALGFDSREATPGFKRQLIILNAETRSFKRAAIVMKQVVGLEVSTNTIERISIQAGNDLAQAKQDNWTNILGKVADPPDLAIVEFDGGRIRTRQTGCGPGVHLNGEGWNETKNAIFVKATSQVSEVDPDPTPPACFYDPAHVSKLTEQSNTKKNERTSSKTEEDSKPVSKTKRIDLHKPVRLVRTVISSMNNTKKFGQQMAREAKRRRFGDAVRKAYLGDGLPCNWAIHKKHFSTYTPILDFPHAVSYIFAIAVISLGKTEEAWTAYMNWMTLCWQGKIKEVLVEFKRHQERIGVPLEKASKDDPPEELRLAIGYLENNVGRMKYDEYRCKGLPVTTAWMESLVKEINYRVKGTEMFWNNPEGAEAILQIRAAALSEDDRLINFLTNPLGQATIRREPLQAAIAA
ncbi:MAG TPA: hypothetical protein VM260_10835 [Pirellula sp.]|nr:hypothetical protein [Pirellula sp.]